MEGVTLVKQELRNGNQCYLTKSGNKIRRGIDVLQLLLSGAILSALNVITHLIQQPLYQVLCQLYHSHTTDEKMEV